MARTFLVFSVQKVKKDIGDVSILVNNAGVITAADLLSTQDHQIERMFEVNILAHIWVRATTIFTPIFFGERCWEGVFRLTNFQLAVNYKSVCQTRIAQGHPARLTVGKLD